VRIHQRLIPYSFKVEANSLTARILLAMVTTAGIFYVNILPILIGGLVDGLGFSKQQAGYVASANIYGAALGVLFAALLIKAVPWKQLVGSSLVLLIVMEIGSSAINQPMLLVVVRFIAGVFGGVITGIAIAVIARTHHPDRSFGVMLVMQFGLGGLGLLLLPDIVVIMGPRIIFLTIATLSFLALAIIPLLSDYPVVSADHHTATAKNLMATELVILTLLAIFFFQASGIGVFAFIERLGQFYHLSIEWISFSLALSSWVGIPGSFAAILLSTRFGRLAPIVGAIAVACFGFWLLLFAKNPQVFLWGNILLAFAWAFILPYLFGICAELDKVGQMAAFGGMASKIGLATGPLVAAKILSGDNYELLIYTAIAGLIVCLLAAAYPALILDKHRIKQNH